MTTTTQMTLSDARLTVLQALAMRTAKALLEDSERYTLTDAAFGDAEVNWYKNGEHIASGYFSWQEARVDIFDPEFTFTDKDARQLRRCGIEAATEENAQEYLDDIRSGYEYDEYDADDHDDEAQESEDDEDDWDVYDHSDDEEDDDYEEFPEGGFWEPADDPEPELSHGRFQRLRSGVIAFVREITARLRR